LNQIPESKFAAEPNPSFGSFNRSVIRSPAPEDGERQCKSQTIGNSLCLFNLDWHIVLIFQEFLFDQER